MNEYFNLEIETIKKRTFNVESPPSDNGKVYYDANRQVIVIDAALQNQSLTLEIVDVQGKVVLRDTNTSKNNFISVANLTSGVYLYRLSQNKRVVYSGKILKNN